jgi:hypothetical protein
MAKGHCNMRESSVGPVCTPTSLLMHWLLLGRVSGSATAGTPRLGLLPCLRLLRIHGRALRPLPEGRRTWRRPLCEAWRTAVIRCARPRRALSCLVIRVLCERLVSKGLKAVLEAAPAAVHCAHQRRLLWWLALQLIHAPWPRGPIHELHGAWAVGRWPAALLRLVRRVTKAPVHSGASGAEPISVRRGPRAPAAPIHDWQRPQRSHAATSTRVARSLMLPGSGELRGAGRRTPVAAPCCELCCRVLEWSGEGSTAHGGGLAKGTRVAVTTSHRAPLPALSPSHWTLLTPQVGPAHRPASCGVVWGGGV